MIKSPPHLQERNVLKDLAPFCCETAVAGYHRASPSTSLDKVHLHIQILIILILLLLDQLSMIF